ncbi:hypothetical protein ABW20_dc0102314 [Dactylellina cionopaga]|nr:hypothetical protein ABW20_dc0102314 [Dactylellina cionopaga]
MGVKKEIIKAAPAGADIVRKGDKIQMHYTGTLADNGKKFDSSVDRGQPFELTIGVGQVIKGWDDGILGKGDGPAMRVGEKAKLTMTSDFAYGTRGAGGAIPPNADLIFEVELLKILVKAAGGKEEL